MSYDTKSSQLISEQQLRRYYRLQSRIYDLTRWSFLFGRRALIEDLPYEEQDTFSVLEVGCGTGRNLRHLARAYPRAIITGIDLSEDMVRIARKKIERLRPHSDRVEIVHGAFGTTELPSPTYDVIVFSYCLTIINPGFENLIKAAANRLTPQGYLAVCDFHDSPLGAFRRHMARHHVRMEG